jgi:hypothetical protein
MIDDLSNTLQAILTAELSGAQIAFEHPAETFNPAQTTVDLFLYDIRENVELRNNEPVVVRNNGQVTTRRPPLRVACTYLVTAWPVGLTGDAAALLEHRLLSQVLRLFSGLPTIPATFLKGSLVGQQPPLPMVTALVDPQKNLSEFWTALGNKLRPSISVTATIAMEVIEPETAPMVITERLRFGERTAAEEDQIIPDTLQELLRIGGQITNAANAPVAGAAVTIVELGLSAETDQNGRFVFDRMKSGAFTLRVKKAAAERDVTINVPSSTGSTYNVQLG